MRTFVQGDLDERGYGLVIESIGITKLELPPAVVQSVFQRMATERNALAERAREIGAAAGSNLQTEAREDARTINAFADQQAAAIESRGEQEAAARYAQLEGPAAELATLLDELETVTQSINGRDRWFIQVTDLYPFSTLVGNSPEQSPDQAEDGQ